METAADEMIGVMRMTAETPPQHDETYTGLSYKEILAQKKKQKQGGVTAQPVATLTEPVVAQPVTPEPVVVPEPIQETPIIQSPVAAQATPAPVEQVQPVVTQPVVAASTPAVAASGDQEEIRRTIRTLMGLLLKHRGGPNFGKGRLKGTEIQRFESVLAEVTNLLRSEMGSGPAKEVAASVPSVSAPAVPVAPAAPAVPAQPVLAAPMSTTITTGANPVPAADRMASTIACVEGAIQMYKNSPPELQEGLVVTLRSALMVAVKTCNEVIVEKGLESAIPGANSVPAADRMASTIACVEGAVQMYKNSPPELQEGLLVTFRSALMAAVNTCNQVIAENEVENVQAYRQTVAPPVAESAAVPPTQFFEVTPYTPPTESGEVSTPEPVVEMQAPTGTDENSQLLLKVYDSLVASSGNEKFGLGKLSGAEVSPCCRCYVATGG